MRITPLAALAATIVLAACGGGGGGGGDSGGSTAATVALAGTAAKGLLANADVAVYPVNADGSVGSTALATGATGTDGRYSLNFTGTQGQPYVVRVTAKAGTTHLDEVTGAAQPLPAGFTMRTLVVPASSGAQSVSANVTPFSELMAAAAAKASGGINATNAAQALSTVKQLLGFDPTAVGVKTTHTASTPDEQKLAVLLTAVSRLADTGGLGCANGSAGDKAKCVVDTLASAASVSSLKLTTGSSGAAVDVSAALGTAISDVLTTPALAGNVSSASLATVMANLGCTTNCNAGTGGGATTVATAIAGARLMFTEIKSDWQAMFSRGGTIGGGAVNREALAFERAMSGLQVPVDVLGKDLGAMLMGIDLYHDYVAGRTSVPTRGRGDNSLFADDGSGNFSTTPATGCGLYTDSTNNVLATTAAEARFIGCAARYFVSRSYFAGGNDNIEWRHAFGILINVDGSFDYTTRARQRVQRCIATGCTITANDALQTDFYAGKLTLVLSAPLGSIRSFTLVGELPGAFEQGGRTLVNLKHAVDVNGTRTVASDGSGSATVGGTITAFKSDSSVEGVLTLKTATLKQVAVAAGGSEVSEGDLALVWKAAGSEFEGRLALTDSQTDASQSARIPTKWVLSGALRNDAGAGTVTEFLRGAFTTTITGLSGYNATLPTSAGNSFGINVGFVGALSASGRPTLEFSIGATSSLFDSENGIDPTVTMQYRTLVGTTPRLVVALTAQAPTSPAGQPTFTLSEATSNIAMSWTGDQPATVDLMYAGNTRIGTLNTGTGILTFSDGSFISLDIGL